MQHTNHIEASSEQWHNNVVDPNVTKKQNRKRKALSKTQQLLNDLPEGIRFIGRPDQYSEEYFAHFAKLQNQLEKGT